MVPLPPEAGDGREVAEELKNFSEEDAVGLIPASAKLVKVEHSQMEGAPCVIVEFTHTASNAGIEIETRGLQFCTVAGQHMFTMTGMLAKSAQLDASEYTKQWGLARQLI